MRLRKLIPSSATGKSDACTTPSTFRSVMPPILTESNGNFQPRGDAVRCLHCNGLRPGEIQPEALGITPPESYESGSRIDHELNAYAVDLARAAKHAPAISLEHHQGNAPLVAADIHRVLADKQPVTLPIEISDCTFRVHRHDPHTFRRDGSGRHRTRCAAIDDQQRLAGEHAGEGHVRCMRPAPQGSRARTPRHQDGDSA